MDSNMGNNYHPNYSAGGEMTPQIDSPVHPGHINNSGMTPGPGGSMYGMMSSPYPEPMMSSPNQRQGGPQSPTYIMGATQSPRPAPPGYANYSGGQPGG